MVLPSLPGPAVALVFGLALCLMLAGRLWLISRQIRHVAQHRDQVPEAFAARLALAAHQRAADYTIARQRFELLLTAWGAAVLVGWTLLGGLDSLNVVVRDSVVPRWGPLAYQVVLFIAVTLISSLLDAPWDAWQVFRIEQRHGFNRMTPGLWLRDRLVGALVGLLVGVPLLVAVLWLMDRTGPTWWLWVFAVLALFTLGLQVLYPTVIAPLFNRFTPLEPGELQDRVQALMARCGLRSRGFYVMDGSRRSAHANAYFTGFGAARRVVFFDTLIQQLSPAEIEAVLAHELGHWRLHHVPKRLLLAMVVWLGTLALLAALATQPGFYTGLGVLPNMAAPNHALALLLAMMVAPVFGFFVGPLGAALSRRHEFEADAYACTQARAADLEAALLKLYEDNASTLTPDPLYARVHYSHPPAVERLAAMRHAA